MGIYLLQGATATGAGAAKRWAEGTTHRVYQAGVAGTGAVAATLTIEVSTDPTVMGWLVLATITLSGTTTATDGTASEACWPYMRANCSAISGTGATLNVIAAAGPPN